MDEALKTILTLLGAGGLTTVILGVLGFLKGRPSESTAPQSGVPMFAALYADQASVNRISSAIERMVDAFDRQSDCLKDNTAAMRERTRELQRR